ncbi:MULTISPECIES: Eco57I restriction-modification methylase domain-containing protein [unclassified Methanoregula]|uniref:Eco57I restriction-modification methylase domain-containing protein n=1 Tax=unclassified Methanoregula TaxID=2649730 RepID=UPI0009C50FC3|nr:MULTISPECIES: TaqI-like C-terminal specificity domain-containing protein [unclassified Methanoregula]OPX61777.1 MAG: hypothetical protein A4E33_02879 [Methanoregula sp. PtaB.Bin085]OPY33914.1 MAG: hypothetical protein A4E34_01499 [Methanoregula sp. PtaU1.Bin006]
MPAPIGSDTNAVPPLTPRGSSLLSGLESARDRIARRLAGDHHMIPDPDLNYAIVSSILQALFVKTGEECGFIEPGTVAALAACDGIAGRMARAVSDAGADPAVFFERGPDNQRTVPAVPDEPLRRLLAWLDEPDFPVPVTRLPLEECAGVLDLFLGMRVEAAEGGRVKRSGKSALLYTGSVDVPPWHLIEHVVKETAGPARGNTDGGSAKDYRVLDPACGAGLFLLAAFRFIARSRTRNPSPDQAAGSVFGTDLDPESVSAARFILLLAFIEEYRRSGHGTPSSGAIRDAAFITSRCVRCGNALIAPDYFSGKPVYPFNAEERRRVNPFDWEKGFPEIIAAGGFDGVIGSPPPYRPFAVQAREEYFQTHYSVYASSAGLYGYFIERALHLLQPGGTLGVLVPETFLRSRPARPLRRLLLTRRIMEISATGHSRLLPEGNVPLVYLRLQNSPPAGPFTVSTGGSGNGPAQDSSGVRRFTLDQRQFGDGGWKLEDTRAEDLLEKIVAAGTPLDQYVLGQIDAGTHRLRDNPLVVDTATRDRLTEGAWWCRRFFVPLLSPAEIRRWLPAKPDRFYIPLHDPRHLLRCRRLAEYLGTAAEETGWDHGEDAEENTGVSFGQPASGQGREPPIPKIIFSAYQRRPAFCYDAKGSYAMTNALVAIHRNDRYLLALLNSALGRFIITRTCPLTDRGYHVIPPALGKFPVVTPDFDKLRDKTRHNKLVSLVTDILELNRYLAKATTEQERRLVQQEIDATDVRIDALVYEMYGLTPEEIAVVEGSSR